MLRTPPAPPRLLLAALLCLLLSGCADDSGQPAAPPPAAPPLAVTAVQLGTDYSGNEVAADTKYKGKVLLLSGTVIRVATDFPGEIDVYLQADQGDFVDCSFSEDAKATLATVQIGQKVTVRGTCGGKGASPFLNDCTLP